MSHGHDIAVAGRRDTPHSGGMRDAGRPPSAAFPDVPPRGQRHLGGKGAHRPMRRALAPAPVGARSGHDAAKGCVRLPWSKDDVLEGDERGDAAPLRPRGERDAREAPARGPALAMLRGGPIPARERGTSHRVTRARRPGRRPRRIPALSSTAAG